MNNDNNENRKKELAAWINKNWQLKAKALQRSCSPDTGRVHEKHFKAPYGFAQTDTDKRKGIQLVVLVYFDGEKDYKVFAYPCKLEDKITWIRKSDGRVTFDSNELDSEFKFDKIEHFKKEFPVRFPDSFRLRGS